MRNRKKMSPAEFKELIREQFLILRLDEKMPIALIHELLKGHESEGPQLLIDYIRRIATAGGPLHEEVQERLAKMERIFSGQNFDKAFGPSLIACKEASATAAATPASKSTITNQ